MAMVCPKCEGTYNHQLECPQCGVHLNYRVDLGVPGGAGADMPRWQQSALGRVVIGLVLTQGLALGLRMALDAGLRVNPDAEHAVWSTLLGLVLIQGMQMIGLLVAGALAGAGQHRGFILGAFVGFINSMILIVIQIKNGHPITEVAIYSQPLLHIFFGGVGGFAGSSIWKPLPVIELAQPLKHKKAKPKRTQDLFEGPIAWTQVVLGTLVATCGVISARVILEFVLRHSDGELQIASRVQSHLLTWEIAGLAVLLGAGFAGMSTFNGLKQGLCVGVASGLLTGYYRYCDPKIALSEAVGLGFFVFGVALVGGWFGCRLFPPVARRMRSTGSPY